MFDDIPNKPGTVPPNLPTGEPEDMFADTDATPEASAPAALPSEDQSAPAVMPTAPASALGAGVLRPKQATTPLASAPRVQTGGVATMSQSPSQTTPVGGAETQNAYRVTEPSIGKGILLVVVVVVAAIILGGGGWYIYQRFVVVPQANDATVPPTVDDTSEQPTGTQETPIDTGSTDIGTDIVDDQVLFGEPIDTDGDGLDDATETDIGTSASNWDTDNDGLGDRDETVIWKTDPNNPDTDGDTYLDGTEVTAGYSPTGPGKLFTPPTSTPQ